MLEFLRASARETGADLEMKVDRFCLNWRVVQNTRSITGRQTGVDPWRIVTARPYVSVWDMWADRHGIHTPFVL